MRSGDTSAVIPFPNSDQTGYRRLSRALDGLLEEHQNQAKAIAHFQETMAKLQAQVEELRGACEDYRDVAKGLDVQPLQTKARRLASIVGATV